MIIKNILILNNDGEYINLILNELCKNNISYTYIKENHELHFNKYIIRFFTKKDFIIYWKSKKMEFYDSIFETNNKIRLYEFNEFSQKEKYKIYLDLQNQTAILNLKNNNSKNSKTLKKQLNPTRKIYR